MIVTPIAHTYMKPFLPESVEGTAFAHRAMADLFSTDTDVDTLHEFAGRACYQAWHMPNPATATNDGYLGNIVRQGHFSVLEHGSVTFYVEGVSRAMTHELIRHRHLSFSELSQRFVNMEDAELVQPPAMRDAGMAHVSARESMELVCGDYGTLVERLTDAGLPPKQAREAARAVMPNATETKIVVTGNLRAWRDVLAKRWHVAADAEIREFSGEILRHLRTIAPSSVADIPEEPYSD